MNRRGLFRLGGGLLGAGAAAKAAAAAPGGHGMIGIASRLVNVGVGWREGDTGASESSDSSATMTKGPPDPVLELKRAAFRRLMAAENDRRRRQRMVADMLGGPPHLVSMHSNAAWFRAQRAAEWYAELDNLEWRDALRRSVGLE